MVSHWPRPTGNSALLFKYHFQISFSLSTAGTLWFLLYFWPFISLMVRLMKLSGRGVWTWLKRPTQDQRHLPMVWDDPLRRWPTVSKIGTQLFSPPRGWVIWPLSTFGPDPFLTNHTYGMISGWGPWPRTKFPCVDFSTVDICAELME